MMGTPWGVACGRGYQVEGVWVEVSGMVPLVKIFIQKNRLNSRKALLRVRVF